MKETLKPIKPIQNMMTLILLVLSFLLATQTSVLAQPLCDGKVPTILGTAGHDVLEGTAGPDIIHGLGGHDVIEGKGGDDVICGGDGHDVISGDDGDDTLIGDKGADHLVGGAGNDYLSGGNGHDELFGCAGDDEMWGNWGNDTLMGGDGADVFWGGTGPNNGALNNNDTCYDTLSSFIRGCEVFYGEKTLRFTPVPKTGQTQSYAAGDDGDLQKGVQWPDPRFTDNGDGTVTDHLTGLIWLANFDCFGEVSWYEAVRHSNDLGDGQCGLSDGSAPGDWRLPNVREKQSIVDHGDGWTHTVVIPRELAQLVGMPPWRGRSYRWWTSTSRYGEPYYLNGIDDPCQDPSCAHIHRPLIDREPDRSHLLLAWPVRGSN